MLLYYVVSQIQRVAQVRLKALTRVLLFFFAPLLVAAMSVQWSREKVIEFKFRSFATELVLGP